MALWPSCSEQVYFLKERVVYTLEIDAVQFRAVCRAVARLQACTGRARAERFADWCCCMHASPLPGRAYLGCRPQSQQRCTDKHCPPRLCIGQGSCSLPPRRYCSYGPRRRASDESLCRVSELAFAFASGMARRCPRPCKTALPISTSLLAWQPSGLHLLRNARHVDQSWVDVVPMSII